jgi:dTDP-4-dehydrorhamnose 3,5-epimerase
VTDYYAPSSEAGLLWNDPALGVDWPADIEVFINARDAGWPALKDFDSPFIYGG